jgi:hypothetical protein
MRVKVTDEESLKIAKRYGLEPDEIVRLEDNDVVFITGTYLDRVLEAATLTGITDNVVFIAPDTEEADEDIRELYGLPDELLKNTELLRDYVNFIRESARILREEAEVDEELKNVKATIELNELEKKISHVLRPCYKSEGIGIEYQIYDFKIFTCPGSEFKNLFVLVEKENQLKVLKISGFSKNTTDTNIRKNLYEFLNKFFEGEEKINFGKSVVNVSDITQNMNKETLCNSYMLFLKKGNEWKVLIPRGELPNSIPKGLLGFVDDYYLVPLFEDRPKYRKGVRTFLDVIDNTWKTTDIESYKGQITKLAKQVLKLSVFHKKIKELGLDEKLGREDFESLREELYNKVIDFHLSKEKEIIAYILLKIKELRDDNSLSLQILEVALASVWRLFLNRLSEEIEDGKLSKEFIQFFRDLEGKEGRNVEDKIHGNIWGTNHNTDPEGKVINKVSVQESISQVVEELIKRINRNTHPRKLILALAWITLNMVSEDCFEHGSSTIYAKIYLSYRHPSYFPAMRKLISDFSSIPYQVLRECRNSEDCEKAFRMVIEQLCDLAVNEGIPLKLDTVAEHTILNQLTDVKELVKGLFKEFLESSL